MSIADIFKVISESLKHIVHDIVHHPIPWEDVGCSVLLLITAFSPLILSYMLSLFTKNTLMRAIIVEILCVVGIAICFGINTKDAAGVAGAITYIMFAFPVANIGGNEFVNDVHGLNKSRRTEK